jgi:hypothetical protein
VALTPAGEVLLTLARGLLREAEALPVAVRAAAAGLSGWLRLAFVSTIAYGPLPPWLRSFREHLRISNCSGVKPPWMCNCRQWAQGASMLASCCMHRPLCRLHCMCCKYSASRWC